MKQKYEDNKEYAKTKASEASDKAGEKSDELKQSAKDTGVGECFIKDSAVELFNVTWQHLAAQNKLGDSLESAGDSLKEAGQETKDPGLVDIAKGTLQSVGDYLGLTTSAEPEK